MNNKAFELELYDTHFINPEGLHDKNQYTTISLDDVIEAMRNISGTYLDENY